MNFSVEKEIFDCFPGMKIAAVVVRGFNNQIHIPEVILELKQSWADAGKAATEFGNPQSHPNIKPWINHLKELGVSRKNFPSSIEALVRRAGKGGEPMSINPLVDFYNSISMEYIVPAGGFDIDGLNFGLELRFSHVGDEFQALDDSEAFQIPEGEVSYADGSRILTRHFLWRQSKIGLITPDSKNVLLVSEIPGELDDAVCEKVVSSFMEGIQKYFHTNPSSHILSVSNPVIEI